MEELPTCIYAYEENFYDAITYVNCANSLPNPEDNIGTYINIDAVRKCVEANDLDALKGLLNEGI